LRIKERNGPAHFSSASLDAYLCPKATTSLRNLLDQEIYFSIIQRKVLAKTGCRSATDSRERDSWQGRCLTLQRLLKWQHLASSGFGLRRRRPSLTFAVRHRSFAAAWTGFGHRMVPPSPSSGTPRGRRRGRPCAHSSSTWAVSPLPVVMGCSWGRCDRYIGLVYLMAVPTHKESPPAGLTWSS
jgi:hypothetical protein